MAEASMTLKDPVSQEERDLINKLDVAKAGIAEKNLQLDLEKVNLVAATRRIEAQYQEIFKKILIDRGLSIDTLIQIDLNSGQLRIVPGASKAAPEAPPKAVADQKPPTESSPEPAEAAEDQKPPSN